MEKNKKTHTYQGNFVMRIILRVSHMISNQIQIFLRKEIGLTSMTNNLTFNRPLEIVDISFANSFTPPNPTKNFNQTNSSSTIINLTCISEEEVLPALKNVNAKMNTGLDIPPFLIKDGRYVFFTNRHYPLL